MAGHSESRLAERVLVGAIAAPHGVRGLVKVKSFTADPAGIAAYGPLTDETGRRRVVLRVMSAAGGGAGTLICRIDGVADRDAAEALRGLRLYVERAALPAPEEDEYYQADLIGLTAELADGTILGQVVAVQNYGAGDLLEIDRGEGPRPAGAPRLVDLPFTRAAVPRVDLPGRRLVVDPPAGLLEPGGPEAKARDSAAGERKGA
jgi:16S rRNA processing protein RimM